MAGCPRQPVRPGALAALVRQPGPDARELGPRFEPVLGVGEEQLARLVQRGAVADADQHVLQSVAARIGVVHLVGHHRGQAGALRQLGQLGHQPVVVRLQVVAQLDREVAIREVAGPRLRGGERCLRIAGQQLARHLSAATARQADQVAARLVQGGLHQRALEDGELLLPRQVAAGGEPRQRGVAGAVARQQDQVVARHRSGVELAGPAAAGLLPAQRIVQLPPTAGEAQRPLVGGDRQLQPHDGRHR